MSGLQSIRSGNSNFAWFRMSAVAFFGIVTLSACQSTPSPEPEPIVAVVPEPEPEPVVEIYKPEPLPSIDISEWERQQANSASIAERLERLRLEQDANETEVEQDATSSEAALPPIATPRPEPTLDERLAATADPDARIAILHAAPAIDDIPAKLRQAYEDKLAAAREANDMPGAAQALVWLGEADNGSQTREARLSALRRFAEAQELDPSNAKAPGLVSRVRAELQNYADDLHAQAVELFVKQDFNPAVSRWETVLLIDPGNTAARNWFEQASEALGR